MNRLTLTFDVPEEPDGLAKLDRIVGFARTLGVTSYLLDHFDPDSEAALAEARLATGEEA